jgi:hypothetical protein
MSYFPWRDLREGEIQAARARAEQLTAHHHRLTRYLTTSAIDQLDRAIAAISRAVRGEIIGGPSLETARATITALFDSFTLNRHGNAYTLTPRLRPEVLLLPTPSDERDSVQGASTADTADILRSAIITIPDPNQIAPTVVRADLRRMR